MESCIMHERAPACVYRCVWVCPGEGRVCMFIPRTLCIGSHSEEMRCLIVQSICCKIGRRGGKDTLVNMNESGLH